MAGFVVTGTHYDSVHVVMFWYMDHLATAAVSALIADLTRKDLPRATAVLRALTADLTVKDLLRATAVLRALTADLTEKGLSDLRATAV